MKRGGGAYLHCLSCRTASTTNRPPRRGVAFFHLGERDGKNDGPAPGGYPHARSRAMAGSAKGRNRQLRCCRGSRPVSVQEQAGTVDGKDGACSCKRRRAERGRAWGRERVGEEG